MSTPGISAPAETEVRISDAYLEAHKNETRTYIDCENLTPNDAFVRNRIPATGNNAKFYCRGIHIDGGSQADGTLDRSATQAEVNRELTSGVQNYQVTYSTHQTHPDRVRRIFPFHTTARGIMLKG